VGQVAHLVTRFGESLVVFGASLDGSRLASAGAMGKENARDGEEHFILKRKMEISPERGK